MRLIKEILFLKIAVRNNTYKYCSALRLAKEVVTVPVNPLYDRLLQDIESKESLASSQVNFQIIHLQNRRKLTLQ